MKTDPWNLKLLVPVVVATLFLIDMHPSVGQPRFFDDFTGGPLEDPQRTPVVWDIFQEAAGTIEVVDGDVVMTPAVDIIFGATTEFAPDDFTIRIQARFLGSGAGASGFLGVGGRIGANSAGDNSLWGGMRSNGTLAIGRVLGDAIQIVRDFVAVDVDPVNEDFHLELTVRGNEIGLTGWQEGAVKPDCPQATFSDERVPAENLVDFFYNPSDNLVPVAIRSFEVLAIPEPSTAVLLTLLLVCGAGCHRQRSTTR